MKVVVFGLAPVLFFSGCMNRAFNESDESALGHESSLTSGSQIGLKAGEIALTLDDGPVPESLGIAKELAKRNIPVTYFMIGQRVSEFPTVAKQISELKLPNGDWAGIIANHSWSHKRKVNSIACIACDGTDYAIKEVADADKVMSKMIDTQRKPYFFRAPGGNFFRAGNAGEMASLNELNKVMGKYIGPFMWDVDGDVNPGPCQQGALACRNFYYDQVKSNRRNGLIILAHDIHQMTRDMLLGTSAWPGLIDRLKAEGFTFVALDKYPAALEKFGTVPKREFGNVTFFTENASSANYKFNIQVPNAARIEVWIDRKSDGPLFGAHGSEIKGKEFKFQNTGTRIFTIKGFDASNKLIALGTRTVNIVQ